jgi:hypothetical protein
MISRKKRNQRRLTKKLIHFLSILLPMGDLYIPTEILHVIAAYHVRAYRALLAIPMFARSVMSGNINYMKLFGYSTKIAENGNEYWYCNDELYYIKVPANTPTENRCLVLHNTKQVIVDLPNIGRLWYYDGKLHRSSEESDGPGPSIERVNGDKGWCYYGYLHRGLDRPAIERVGGVKEWFYRGDRHRDFGRPVVERVDGIKEWWVNGYRLTKHDIL